MNRATLICCSALKAEIEQLCAIHWPDHPLRFVSSTMHLHPERLAASLRKSLESEREKGAGVVLVFGDCCARMTAMEAMPGVVRTRGRNCLELLIGAEEYQRLSHEGAFFVMPRWARRWKRFFSGLGLNRDNASSMMQDLHRTLIYLDTGVVPVPETALRECADYCGIPYEVWPVPLDNLHTAMNEAMHRKPRESLCAS